MERYVYVLNAGKYGNTNINYDYADKGNAFTGDVAFKNTSVNPVLKCTNINAEHSGLSANFFEIRNTHYEGEISNASHSAIVNRIYPSTNKPNIVSDATYGKNKQQTTSFKIRTYTSTSATNSNDHANQLLVGNSSLNMDLDTYDYFVLINPQIAHSTSDSTPSIRPHFAKITNIISFDEHGDGFEFEPKYPEAIAKDTNFEIYKGPLVSDTSVVAVSYGLRGDGTELGISTNDDYDNSSPVTFITDKYDAGSEVSRPTWYFYNDRLQNEDRLDYGTKYNLTTCRCFNWASKGTYTNTSGISQYASNNVNLTSTNFSGIIGQSVYQKLNDNSYVYMGNVISYALNIVKLEYAVNAIASVSGTDDNIYVGRTIHQSVFRTEREYGTDIEDYGSLNQHAVLVDRMYNKDGEIGITNQPTDYETGLTTTYSFNPCKWKDAFRNARRNINDYSSTHPSYHASGANARHAGLSGANRYAYYKTSHKKNNAINPIMSVAVNNPKNKLSQFASTTVMDNNGIQFLKIKEDEKYSVTKSLHTSTTSDVKLPFTATTTYSSIGTTFQINLNNIHETSALDWKPTIDYHINQVIKPDTILKIKEVYYRVKTIVAVSSKTQSMSVSHKKQAKDKQWIPLTASHANEFTDSGQDVFIMCWNGGLNTLCPIDTEAVYESNTLQRLTINEKTVSKKDTSLYKKTLSLLNKEFYGFNIEIDYGDKNHNHIKLLTNKTFYQPSTSKKDFMYYYQGGYCIEDEVFNGTVEDINSKNENGMLTYTVNGRDNTSILLNNTTNKNLHKSDDIIYSTLPPVFIPTTTITNELSTNGNLIKLNAIDNTIINRSLLFNSNNELIGEIGSHTSVYRVDGSSGFGQVTQLTIYGMTDKVALSDNVLKVITPLEANYIAGTKALAANTKLTTHPTDFSSLGNNGLIFNDGNKINVVEGTLALSYSKLLNTSATGSYNQDNSIGYDITDIKSISEGLDSNFALKLSKENRASIDYKNVQTVSSMYFSVISIDTSSDTNTTIKLAPNFPVVLGSIDTNESDDVYDTDLLYLYMVNSNIPNGGFIHGLKDASTTYYTPKSTFRYWGLQRFSEGTIKETHDSIYDNSKKTQRITAATPMFKIKASGEKITPTSWVEGKTATDTASDITSKLTPHSGSNIWTGADMGLTNSRKAPVEYWDSGVKTVHWKQLENIDYRAKNYELLSIGDIYPDSKLRWNSLQYATQEMNEYGLLLKTKGQEGSVVAHEKYTGSNTQTQLSDSNYERVEITTSNKTTNQLKRFGVMRLVEATFDWHMNPIDYESVAGNNDYDKITNFKYPRMKVLYEALVDEHHTGYVDFDTITDGSGSSVTGGMTLSVGDIIYRADGTVLAKVNTAGTYASGRFSLVGLSPEITLYTPTPVANEKVYVITQKLFSTLADDGFGIDSVSTNPFRMLNNYIVLPNITKDYFEFKLLEKSSKKFDAHNVFVPLISDTIHLGATTQGYFHDFASLFHEAKSWDSSNTSIWYHPSKSVYGLAYPTTDVEHAALVRDDPIQYKIGNKADLYGKSMILFKNMKKSFSRQTEDSFTLPTSAPLDRDILNNSTNDNYIAYENEMAEESLNQVAPNIMINKIGDEANPASNSYHTYCGMKTIKHIYSAPNGESRTWGGRSENHISSNTNEGGLFQAQTFIKPRLILTSTNAKSFSLTMNDSSDNLWLDFVPNLEGYYLVSEKMGSKYIPSSDVDGSGNTLPHTVTGSPDYIGKIITHTTNKSGDYTSHTITLDKTLNTSSDGTSFRLMRISETTFEDTPDYFEVNKMFDTGLKYTTLKQNFVTTVEEESGADLKTNEEGVNSDNPSDLLSEYLAYQQGLYSMYLLLNIDTFNTYIDRRTLADAKALFTDGDSLNCYITDGRNKQEKNIIVSETTDSLRFSYDGTLTGYGVVSFGETFTIETRHTPSNSNATEAFIGTTISIGTDVEQAMLEILEENEISTTTSLKNMTFTGNIIDANTSGTTITFTTNHSGINVDDVLYNQDGRLVGKVTTASAGTTVVVSNIYYKPIKNDEITKYDRTPFILNTEFNEQDIFSSINYLASKRGLDYVFDNNNIIIKDLNNYDSRRKFSLKYNDGANLISVESNTSLFDKANKILVIGDNVKAEVETPSNVKRTIKHIDSNIKNSEEARIKAHNLLEIHQAGFRKIELTLEKTGFELMKAGDILTLDFPNHNIPADDYIVFEIENVMSTISKITVGTFNKTIAERLSEISLNQDKGFTGLLTRNINKTLTGKMLIDNIAPKEKSLHYALTSTTGGTIIGFN